jgi:hypothetical protein
VARRGLLIVLGVNVKPGGSHPRSARELKRPGLAARCTFERDAPVSSVIWISGVAALAAVAGTTNSCATAVDSSRTRASTPSISMATGPGGNVPSTPTMASAEQASR